MKILKYNCNCCRNKQISALTCLRIDTFGICQNCFDLLSKDQSKKEKWLKIMNRLVQEENNGTTK